MEAGPQRPRRKAQPKHAWTLWASASALGLDVSISVRKALMARTRSAAAGCRILSRKAAKVSGCVGTSHSLRHFQHTNLHRGIFRPCD